MGSQIHAPQHNTHPLGFRVFELGRLRSGRPVEVIELSAGQLRVGLCCLGARIIYVTMPDRRAQESSVCLRYPTAEDYELDKIYLGATVGRVANRINSGQCKLGAEKLSLSKNEPHTGHHLHGGRFGLDGNHWSFKILRCSGDPQRIGVAFTTYQPAGHEGYPGRLNVSAIYTVDIYNRLSIELRASADATTIVNLTNHTYWNLSGRADEGSSIGGHMLRLSSESYLERSHSRLPTGQVLPVEDTAFDFRQARPMEEQLERFADGNLDHFFVTPADAPRVQGIFHASEVELRQAATLIHPGSGRQMDVATDQPGLQVYAAHTLSRASQGRWRDHSGLCLETQGYPDAPNHPNFPSITLERGDTSIQKTQFTFSIID